MNDDVVIRVENLGKKYSLHHEQQERYRSLRDSMVRQAQQALAWANPFTLRGQLRRADIRRRASDEEFWALKGVSFEIKRGERVGFIGRNGAGKSTLLKILSRITEPSTGRVEIHGRVASLLEVGTGFHPELTGKENIYLNGAILGMSHREIRRKFDEIVAFAEVEKFLDTPVKRYSSGMYVRLAFAVAAHLEPEILIVDEVLAVGDAQFQKKCLGKMEKIGRGGRTVLFVSHNMSTIQSLCSRCVLLKKGQVVTVDQTPYVVQKYLKDDSASASFVRPQQNNGYPTIISGEIITDEFEESKIKVIIKISTELNRKVALCLRLYDALGFPVGLGALGDSNPSTTVELTPGVNKLCFSFLANQLAVGSYFICLDLYNPNVEYYDRAENCLSFEFTRRPAEGYLRVLSQSDGYGSVEFPLQLLSYTDIYQIS